MICCNHNCREGRDCPLRRTRTLPSPWGIMRGVTRAMGRAFERAHLQWALREMGPMHPDLPHVVQRLRDLETP